MACLGIIYARFHNHETQVLLRDDPRYAVSWVPRAYRQAWAAREHVLDPFGARAISGPFHTEIELNEAVALKYVDCGRPNYKADFYRRAFKSVFQGHEIRFTHGDLHRRNVIVDLHEGNCCTVTTIDWEKSGWMPGYWEYSKAMVSVRWDDDWSDWLNGS